MLKAWEPGFNRGGYVEMVAGSWKVEVCAREKLRPIKGTNFGWKDEEEGWHEMGVAGDWSNRA